MKTLLQFVLLVLAGIWKGYVLTILWKWFISPIFGLPALSIPVALGVVLVAQMLTYNYVKGEEKEQVELIIFWLVFPAVTLVYGWILTWFI